jgi:adenylosuccinate lyase
MVVNREAMRRNLDSSRGLIYSGTVLLALARKGVSREDAYAWVQAAAMPALAGRGEFRELLAANPEIAGRLSPAEIDRCCDLDHHLRHVDTLFRRVFGRSS